MPIYLIAFVISVLLLVVLGFMQITMRRQVHEANYGHQEISPWDVRFANDLNTIWKLHKAAYKHSVLRSWLLVVAAAWVAAVAFAGIDYLVVSH